MKKEHIEILTVLAMAGLFGPKMNEVKEDDISKIENLENEYELIKQKKSNLSANQRHMIINIFESENKVE